MSTLGNAVAVLIFCLPSSLSALLYHHLPIKEASAEPVWAPVREAFLVARAAQLLHPAPGEGRLLVESSEVPGSGSCLQEHRRHSVVFPGNTGFSDVPSSLNADYCRLHTGVSRMLMMGSVCIFMCVCCHCFTMRLKGLILKSFFLSWSWPPALQQK